MLSDQLATSLRSTVCPHLRGWGPLHCGNPFERCHVFTLDKIEAQEQGINQSLSAALWIFFNPPGTHKASRHVCEQCHLHRSCLRNGKKQVNHKRSKSILSSLSLTVDNLHEE